MSTITTTSGRKPVKWHERFCEPSNDVQFTLVSADDVHFCASGQRLAHFSTVIRRVLGSPLFERDRSKPHRIRLDYSARVVEACMMQIYEMIPPQLKGCSLRLSDESDVEYHEDLDFNEGVQLYNLLRVLDCTLLLRGIYGELAELARDLGKSGELLLLASNNSDVLLGKKVLGRFGDKELDHLYASVENMNRFLEQFRPSWASYIRSKVFKTISDGTQRLRRRPEQQWFHLSYAFPHAVEAGEADNAPLQPSNGPRLAAVSGSAATTASTAPSAPASAPLDAAPTATAVPAASAGFDSTKPRSWIPRLPLGDITHMNDAVADGTSRAPRRKTTSFALCNGIEAKIDATIARHESSAAEASAQAAGPCIDAAAIVDGGSREAITQPAEQSTTTGPTWAGNMPPDDFCPHFPSLDEFSDEPVSTATLPNGNTSVAADFWGWYPSDCWGCELCFRPPLAHSPPWHQTQASTGPVQQPASALSSPLVTTPDGFVHPPLPVISYGYGSIPETQYDDLGYSYGGPSIDYNVEPQPVFHRPGFPYMVPMHFAATWGANPSGC